MPDKKAIVVECGKGWAVILLPGGEYRTIRTNQYLAVGELYRLKNRAAVKYLAAAAIFLFILLGSIDYYTVQAYAQVSSLKLGINRWGRVVSVQAGNEEGKRILNKVEIQNVPLETAVTKITRTIKEEKPSGQEVMIKTSLSVKGKTQINQKFEQKMLDKMDKGLQKNGQGKDMNDKKLQKNKFEQQNLQKNSIVKQKQQEGWEGQKTKKDKNKIKLEQNNRDLEKPGSKAESGENMPVNQNKPANQDKAVKQSGKGGSSNKNTDSVHIRHDD